MYHIVGHSWHPNNYRQYQVRWYGLPPLADTDDPDDHIALSKIMQYQHRTNTECPANLHRALVGYPHTVTNVETL